MKPENDSQNKEVSVEQSRLPTRRDFVKTAAVAAASLAAGSLISCRSTSGGGEARTIKIGFVSPKTGPLAAFAEPDDFVLGGVRKMIGDGIMINGTKHPVVILEKDCQSQENRAAEVASDLIKSDKVDLMLASHTPYVVNPVADQCELNQIPCITNDSPIETFYFVRGGTPDKGFDWTYHFFWGNDDLINVYTDIWQMLPTDKVVGEIIPNDVTGNGFARSLDPGLKRLDFHQANTGHFPPDTNDFSAQIGAFKKAKAQIIVGAVPPPTFSTFWSQAAQQGFKPEIATIAIALLFPSAVEALGDRGTGLTTEVWWSPNHPFKSGMTGQSAAEYCADWESKSGKQWTQPLGFTHALFEVGLDVLKRTKDIDSKSSIMDAVRSTNYQSIVGPVNWVKSPYGNPVKNACKTPLVGGQWVKGTKYKYDLVVVNNKRVPEIPTQAKLQLLPS